MTAEQRIAYVEKQIAAVDQGRQNTLNCPYCDAQNLPGDPFCCLTFGRAIAAIMIRRDMREKADEAEKIAEKVSRN